MTWPLVSVGMPVLNGEKWIRRSLDSLLCQDYPHIEIIISDNASVDATSAICSEYLASGKNIRVIRQKNTLSIAENFRAVLHAAKGKYFMWAAVDDCWNPTFISRLVDKMESNEGYAIAQSGTLNLDEANLEKISYVRFDGKNNPEFCSTLQLTKKIVSPLKYNLYIYGIFKRTLLTEAFAYCPIAPSADRWVLLQFPLAGYKFAYVDAPLYIRTIRQAPVYRRYQNDPYGERVKRAEKQWFDFSALSAIKKMLAESPLVIDCSERVKAFVLFQVAIGRIKLGLRQMMKFLIIKSLPKKIVLHIVAKTRNRDFDYPTDF